MPFEKLAEMILPREVIGGHGAVEKVGDVFKKLTSSNRGVVVTGNTTKTLAGERVKGILETAGIETSIIQVDYATEENVERVKEHTKNFGARVLIGVGGGTKIDIAKKSAFDLGLDFISVPTSASHDGVASPRATISKNGLSSSVEAMMPAALIADTEIIVTAPFRFLAAGAADVLSNLPALKDWNLGHKLKGERVSSSAYAISEFAAREIISNASQIKPQVEESVWLVIKQIVFSGIAMSIAGNSRPASGSEHMFAHAVDSMKKGNGLHGELCGIGSIIAMYLHGADWVQIRNTLQTIGAPTTLAQVSLTEDDAIEALMMAHKTRPDRYTILGESGISETAAREALNITGVS